MKWQQSLAWPFALVGAVAAVPLLYSTELGVRVAAVLVPAGFWWIGWRASRHDHRGWFGWLWLLWTLFVTPLMLIKEPRPGVAIVGVLSAFVVAGACALPLAVFAAAARHPRVARTGSLAARAEARTIWSAGLIPFDMLAATVAFVTSPLRPLVTAAGVAWIVGSKVAFWLADAWLLRRIARFGEEASRMTPLTGEVDPPAPRIDLGVGEARVGDIGAPGDYRRAPSFARIIVGDAAASAEVVRARRNLYAKLACILYGVPFAVAALVALAVLFQRWK